MFDTEWETAEDLLGGRGVLPDGLAEMAPGAALGTELDSVDRSSLNGHELVTLLQARVRQISHLQAQLYADMWELAHTPGGHAGSAPERLHVLDEFASDEIAAALTLSSRAADSQLSFAFELDRLPQVGEALRQGVIDLTRARVFCRETCHLEEEEAQAVAASLLAVAPELTTGQLGARLRRRCLEAHPESARRRYEDAMKERCLEARSNPDGTGDIFGRQLPVDRVGAILSRINAIARQLKGNDDRSMDQIRADILMDLLEGRDTHTAQGKGGVEIRVELTTLMELDEKAAEMPGWGPVVADLARRVVTQQPDSRWEMVVTDRETGQPVWTGATRRRPTAAQARYVRARNPICIFPGCPTPATRSHIDHTVDRARGGGTVITNLGPLCSRHHLRAKHRAGWRLGQRLPGVFVWDSPRGHRYVVRPPPF